MAQGVRVRGARAAAMSRTRTQAKWGKVDRSTDEKQAFTNSMVTSDKTASINASGNNSMADYIKVSPASSYPPNISEDLLNGETVAI